MALSRRRGDGVAASEDTGARTPNEDFENQAASTFFKQMSMKDKYSVAMMLLGNLMEKLEPMEQFNLLNSLLTEYPDREFVESVEYTVSYDKACRRYLFFHSAILKEFKSLRDTVMVPFERKREGAMVEVLREGQKQQDTVGFLGRLFGQHDEEK